MTDHIAARRDLPKAARLARAPSKVAPKASAGHGRDRNPFPRFPAILRTVRILSLLPSRRVLLATLLLLAGGSAGCVASNEGEDDADAGPGSGEGDDPVGPHGEGDAPPVDAKRGPASGNGTGNRPHLHDYWGDQDRVTLFDGEVDLSEPDPFGWSFARLYFEKTPALGGAEWLMPDGATVYEGTGQLDVTASWDDPRVTSLGLSHRSPASQERSSWAALTSGKPHAIEVTPDMTDMPHTTTSRWAFYFAPAEAPGVAMGPIRLKVDIVRMRDVGLFPAHPDLFEGKPEKILHDEAHSFREVSYPKRVPNFVMTGEFGEKEVTLASLVPMETVWMRVEVDVSKVEATPGQVADVRFFYHGADRSAISHPYLLPIEGSLAEKRLVYAFPVAMEETDTPYGKESQWRFFVEPTTKFAGHEDEPDCGGCTDVAIDYRMKVIAYSGVPDMPQSKLEG